MSKRVVPSQRELGVVGGAIRLALACLVLGLGGTFGKDGKDGAFGAIINALSRAENAPIGEAGKGTIAPANRPAK